MNWDINSKISNQWQSRDCLETKGFWLFWSFDTRRQLQQLFTAFNWIRWKFYCTISSVGRPTAFLTSPPSVVLTIIMISQRLYSSSLIKGYTTRQEIKSVILCSRVMIQIKLFASLFRSVSNTPSPTHAQQSTTHKKNLKAPKKAQILHPSSRDMANKLWKLIHN